MSSKSPEGTPGRKPILDPFSSISPFKRHSDHFLISARDLPIRSRGSLGTTLVNPYVKWSYQDPLTEKFVEGGVTSVKQNDPNPDWYDQVFKHENQIGWDSIWLFEVFDRDTESKDELIGSAETSPQKFFFETISIKDEKPEATLKLSNGGTIILSKCETISFRLSAIDLQRLESFNGLSDPHVQCYWSFGEHGPQTLFATTKTIKDVEEAEWNEVIEFRNYIMDAGQYWTFKVSDKDTLSKNDHLGEVSIDVGKFVKWDSGKGVPVAFSLSHDSKNKGKLFVTPLERGDPVFLNYDPNIQVEASVSHPDKNTQIIDISLKYSMMQM